MEKINYRVTLTPAYGRDYKSKKAAIQDFEDGKDFVMHHMTTMTNCSKEDFVPGTEVNIRYKNSTQVAVHRVGKKVPTR